MLHIDRRLLLGDGEKHDGKRGRGANGKIPFEGHLIAIRLSQVIAFSKVAINIMMSNVIAPKASGM